MRSYVNDSKYSDFVQVIDFGIAKVEESNQSQGSSTVCGYPMGTPHYMSPEQIVSAAEVDVRTDVYAVGIILYKALTGHLPFETVERTNGYMLRLLNAQQQESYPRPQQYNRNISLDMESVIDKAIRGNKEDRFESAADMYKALNKAHGEKETLLKPVAPPEKLDDLGENIDKIDPFINTRLSMEPVKSAGLDESSIPIIPGRLTSFQRMILGGLCLVAVVLLGLFLFDRFSDDKKGDIPESSANPADIVPSKVLPAEKPAQPLVPNKAIEPVPLIDESKSKDSDSAPVLEIKSDKTNEQKRKTKPRSRPKPKTKSKQKQKLDIPKDNGKQDEFSFPE